MYMEKITGRMFYILTYIHVFVIVNRKPRKPRSDMSLKDLEILFAMRQDGDTFTKIAKNLGIARITAQKTFSEIESCLSKGLSLNTLIRHQL